MVRRASPLPRYLRKANVSSPYRSRFKKTDWTRPDPDRSEQIQLSLMSSPPAKCKVCGHVGRHSDTNQASRSNGSFSRDEWRREFSSEE